MDKTYSETFLIPECFGGPLVLSLFISLDRSRRIRDAILVKMQAVTLGHLQSRVDVGKPLSEVASDLRSTAAQLVLITEVETQHADARNLVSAELLAEMLRGICRYCAVRGWSADRLVDTAARVRPL